MSQLGEIVTIGVHGFDEATFFDALAAANVDTVCDVRARRGMRGGAYAFANSLRLQESLRIRGYAYVHAKSLAPSPAAREAQRAADAATGEPKRDRGALGDSFGEAYRLGTLADLHADDVVAALPEIADVVAFLCVERLPEACHRGILADWLSSALDLPVRHLTP